MKKILSMMMMVCAAAILYSQPLQFNYQAVVRDAAGKLVREEYLKSNSNHAQLNVGDLAPGIYYYEVICGNDRIPGKFTKQ